MVGCSCKEDRKYLVYYVYSYWNLGNDTLQADANEWICLEDLCRNIYEQSVRNKDFLRRLPIFYTFQLSLLSQFNRDLHKKEKEIVLIGVMSILRQNARYPIYRIFRKLSFKFRLFFPWFLFLLFESLISIERILCSGPANGNN